MKLKQKVVGLAIAISVSAVSTVGYLGYRQIESLNSECSDLKSELKSLKKDVKDQTNNEDLKQQLDALVLQVNDINNLIEEKTN